MVRGTGLGGGEKAALNNRQERTSFHFPLSVEEEIFLGDDTHADTTQAEVWPDLHIHKEKRSFTLQNHYSKLSRRESSPCEEIAVRGPTLGSNHVVTR